MRRRWRDAGDRTACRSRFTRLTLESQILPARVRDYSSEMLDELLATGAVIWSGQKKLGEDDGLVALHLQEYAAESFTPAEAIRRIVRRCNKR
ncbi:ATP-dependent helicase [Escherichia coli]|uniref:ATP-dependent helicase n=1 Tax=Escherichia coli TaxID=562 RepID=A0A2X3JXR5_ECOLX|nr:ATP-dependent helicase [Escherichia coli]